VGIVIAGTPGVAVIARGAVVSRIPVPLLSWVDPSPTLGPELGPAITPDAAVRAAIEPPGTAGPVLAVVTGAASVLEPAPS
jgi:hypothetical protein